MREKRTITVTVNGAKHTREGRSASRSPISSARSSD